MLMNHRIRRVTWVALLGLCLSCVPTKLPPVSSAGSTFEPLKDEVRLWDRSREEERKLLEKTAVYPDPLLEDYLEAVVVRLNPEEMAANPELDYRVRVVEDPTLNAFAFAHGSLYVHTGLLARMENEDQLATVLGHEMTHVENRHMLRYQRSARNKQIGLGITAVAAAVILAGEEGDAYKDGKYGKAARIGVLGDLLIGLGLQLAFVASVNGYGRDLEREADQGGFVKMRTAGYNPREAPKVYQALLADHGDSSKTEAFFFGSHPRLTNRIENANSWIDENSATLPNATPQSGEFERRIRPVIRDDARLNLEAGRLELAELELERVRGMMPEDPETHLLLGRLHLKQAGSKKNVDNRDDLRRRAGEAFREAVRLDPDRPEPHRELGLLAYRSEEFATACVQFRQYAELDPDATDAERIRDYVLELERDGLCP